MMINPGDSVDVHCEWNNDSGKDLLFGSEMCVAFGQYIDDRPGELGVRRQAGAPLG